MAEEPEGEIRHPASLQPSELGFMCGIEVHQQLATGKLHSRQPGVLYDITVDTIPSHWPRYLRKLRPARGEGGNVDIAARFESKRQRSFLYAQSPNAGLIELDEQPPVELDSNALDITLTVAALLDAKPVSLIQTMRKTVVDGSNTSGFQRTSLMATHGKLPTPSGDVGIDVICLEEDSARKLDTIQYHGFPQVMYNLDRLGLPLIEIATAPDVISPAHAKETAIALGRVLRSTRRVRRGLGSIRQDLNVSIAAGDRVEIKGCQDLDWIPRIIELEMARQLHFYRLANELRTLISMPTLPPHRDATDESMEAIIASKVAELLPLSIHDVTSLLSSTESQLIIEGIANGFQVLALPLPHLAGRLGVKELDQDGAQLPRLGRELAGAAKLVGLKGIFHSDELPAYGITLDTVEQVRAHLDLEDDDAFVMCCAVQWQGELALESVLNRARLAWHRIPKEVRNVVVKKGAPDDGTTSPMRPLPGGARMYPETDVPPKVVTSSHWQSILDQLPPSDEERHQRLVAFGLSDDQMKQLLARELDDDFVAYVEQVPAKAWASLLLANEQQSRTLLVNLLRLRELNEISRDHIDVLIEAFDGQSPNELTIREYCLKHGLQSIDASSLHKVIETIIQSRIDFVKERGMAAMGPLMGVVMQEALGADGKEVSRLLREAILQAME